MIWRHLVGPARAGSKRFAIALTAMAALLPLGAFGVGAGFAQQPAQHSASGYVYVLPADQAGCGIANSSGLIQSYFLRNQCVRIDFSVSGTPRTTPESHAVRVELLGPDGTEFQEVNATRIAGDNNWRVLFRVVATAPAGEI